jgi:hypothetical protein
MEKFFLKETKKSLTSNLEQVDVLLDKLFLMVEPIKIFSALDNKSGPYVAVLETVGNLELDSGNPISDESAVTALLPHEEITTSHVDSNLDLTGVENSLLESDELRQPGAFSQAHGE